MVWVGLAFILAGIAWSAYFIRLHRRAVAQAEAAQSWPAAEGVIAESGIAMDESSDSEGNSSQWFSPVLRYTYEVAGRAYEGRRIRFGALRSADRRKAEAWAAPYPVGTRVRVRHHPADPSDSVLETAKPASTYLTASLLGLVFVGLGLFALA